jgi:hypothetical protein
MSTAVQTPRTEAQASGGPPPLTLADVRDVLDARVIWCPDPTLPVAGVVAADLMSEVLVGSQPGQVLLTSLVSLLTVQTAALVDFAGVVFVRGKTPAADLVALAQEKNMPVLVTGRTMFEAAGVLHAAWWARHGLPGGDVACR